jgi:hypothetical protein
MFKATRWAAVLGIAIGSLGLGSTSAFAQEGHTSCRAAGQLAATLAQTLGPGFGDRVSGLAQQGLADDFVAQTHATLCEPK